jgi:hypothetical protein
MTATIGAATSGSRPELISATYRRLGRMGFDDPEAANLTALKNGFGITSQPWTVREVTYLLFVRESCRLARRWSDADDRVNCPDGTRALSPGRWSRSAIGRGWSLPAGRAVEASRRHRPIRWSGDPADAVSRDGRSQRHARPPSPIRTSPARCRG